MTIEPSREERIAEMAAKRALERFTSEHRCRFTHDQAKVLHTLVDEQGGVNVNNVRFLIWGARSIESAAMSISRLIVYGLICAAVIGLYVLSKVTGWNPLGN